MVALSVIIAGTIGNYGDLRDKIALYLDRDDLEDRIPDFIALLEARINRLIRGVNQETRTTWTTSDETYALPSDFRKLRKIHIEGMPDRPLDEIAPQSAAYMFDGQAGTPRAYFIEGRSITFCPPPSTSTTFRVTYFTRIEPLTSDNDSNWLLEEHADIYMFGTLLEAAIYIRDQEAIALCSEKLDQSIAELQRMTRTDRYGGGPLTPKAPTQVRGARC